MKQQEKVQSILNEFDIEKFRSQLIDWFNKEQRILPWRDNQDPYRVWVSEIMLQQTRVDTVIPYFNNFMEQFPTPEALANAKEQDVLKAWEGLGYYSRARNLQNAVREVVAHYEGRVPDNKGQLGDLKGVGPYTQGAILSIAFDQPEPAVDGNVMRVLSRILMVEEDIAKANTKSLFEALVRSLISTDNPSAFNQGLMELGAIICTPKSPSCLLCPVRSECRAFNAGREQDLPYKTKKKKQKKQPYIALFIENEKGEVLIEQRPEEGLLASLWQYPMAPLNEVSEQDIPSWFYGEYGLKINVQSTIDHVHHVFSHLIWDMQVKKAHPTDGALDRKRSRFVSKESIKEYPFPVSHQKIHKHLS
ncbi:A/G-specific adenine glycosylase [Halobacillus sp. Marseille-P3879]|uniref:A/G-specific adenine glycosylase n=1 Tax=Halobacillus sp. Marseille-P3879 TaxID=2045014 RepID=UPI000C799043|nr:A/G-specific adenine glycosylase [Halobacillus sp. Marseille-P3879]